MPRITWAVAGRSSDSAWGQNVRSDSMTSAVSAEIHVYIHTYICLSQHRWWNCKMHYLACSQAGCKKRSQIQKRWKQRTLQSQVLSSGVGYERGHNFTFPEDSATGAVSSSSCGSVASLRCCHADLPSWPNPWKQGQDCSCCHRSFISRQGAERTGYASPALSLLIVYYWDLETQCRQVCVAYVPLYLGRLSKEQPQYNSRLKWHFRDTWWELLGAAETLDLILPPIQTECWASFLSLFGS